MFLHTIVISVPLADILQEPVWQVWGGILISAIIGISGIVIPIILDRSPRKFITYQLRSDAPILSIDGGGLQKRLQVLFDDKPLEDPHLVVLKIRNPGKVLISEDDYNPAPEFFFPEREVLSSEVIETEPPGIFGSHTLMIYKGSLTTKDPGAIKFPPVPLNSRDSITVNALLIGSGESYHHRGRILGGKFLRHEAKRGFSQRTLTFVIPSTFLIGIILTAALLARFIFVAPQPQDCVPGTLHIGGSTAMYPLIRQVADKYQERCPGTNILVNQNIVSSESGLIEVEGQTIDIGDSDVLAPKDKSDLVDHPVAIVNYVVVVSPDITGIGNLSLSQLRDIYSGRITNWNQIAGGPNRPIYVISRSESSGTRQTFQSYALGCTENLATGPNHEELNGEPEVAKEIQRKQGAIGYVGIGTASSMGLKYLTIADEQATPENIQANNYKFWAIEHMYTKGIAQGLTKSFLDYMTSDTARVAATTLHYVDYNLMTPTALNAQQNPPNLSSC